ncbi:hypothetical protein C1X69_21350 [Pseudomonas sp. FW305-67]|nr:hypothetical protein C1X70_19580 [Pseudomonas sp. FW305-53]PMY84962.1 hypothetical protein C1X68_21805 [Pseudomonas sp. FW303-C2]PNA40120.1 hypothetical protein C1X71_24040 [Pseudomonas sp. FW306-2-2C-A10BC]PNB16927.1 hypothetical protein C1X69_21350 [Pseudomonas sp. FW305-67]
MADLDFYNPTTQVGMPPVAGEFPVARELAPAGLRSSPKTLRRGVAVKPHPLFYDCFAAEREQAPSPQRRCARPLAGALESTSSASDSATRKGRRFVLCLPLETL